MFYTPLNLLLWIHVSKGLLTHKSLHVSARISTFGAAKLVPTFSRSAGTRCSLPFTKAFLCERGCQLKHTNSPAEKNNRLVQQSLFTQDIFRYQSIHSTNLHFQRRFLRPSLSRLSSCSIRPFLKTTSRVPKQGKEFCESPDDEEQRTGTCSTTTL